MSEAIAELMESPGLIDISDDPRSSFELIAEASVITVFAEDVGEDLIVLHDLLCWCELRGALYEFMIVSDFFF